MATHPAVVAENREILPRQLPGDPSVSFLVAASQATEAVLQGAEDGISPLAAQRLTTTQASRSQARHMAPRAMNSSTSSIAVAIGFGTGPI
ncbi:hypothetical protein SM11_pC0084 (plasmid) [Sinorhizobium meliloti SM11]|uniref:Uncharacterized protein n=1 Tax=Sinorhizobium meliloti (strain SM11) TaxID=707241 RepID=F7XAX3_SINMM|nr:hypothetical protein SM11_pC0084 [Sinorhizobium meliloti SM11]ARS67268.1 hypothetical protein SMRU11_08815 [Sinorhizobium meliloti RU11/001]